MSFNNAPDISTSPDEFNIDLYTYAILFLTMVHRHMTTFSFSSISLLLLASFSTDDNVLAHDFGLLVVD
jgi:hypothetical protein